MRPLFGPRTVVEAAFLVAVPVIALEVGLGWPAIIGAGAIAYLLVLAVEGAIWREGKREAVPALVSEPVPPPQAETVRVIRAETAEVTATPPAPESAAVAAPKPPRLVPVPTPEPEPVPPPPPAPEPELPPAAAVVPISSAARPRQWNLWDLERVSRDHAGGDPIVDEERTFLLMYLRDFAGPDGLLPVDFDDLVRQSFGGLVANL